MPRTTTCPNCGEAVAPDDPWIVETGACARCGGAFGKLPGGPLRPSGIQEAAPSRPDPGIAPGETGPEEVYLRCPTCNGRFSFRPRQINAPSCPHCAAWYPLDCHRCGLDLGVEGYYTRPLGNGADGPNGQRVWVLFCVNCVYDYDAFAMHEGDQVPCAECGAIVSAGHLRARTFTSSTVQGATVSSQTVTKGLCPACAERVDQGAKSLLSTFAVVGLILAAAGVVLWLMK